MTEQLNFTPSPYAQDRILFVSENRQSVEFPEGHGRVLTKILINIASMDHLLKQFMDFPCRAKQKIFNKAVSLLLVLQFMNL